MVRKELISRTVAALKEKNVRKAISIPKQVFHISDDEGNSRDFKIKKTDKKVLFTADDVDVILETCQDVIQDAIRHGEEVSIHGFGKLGLKYRKEHVVRNVLDNGIVKIDGHFVPRFLVGNDLRRCAQIYEQSLKDQEINSPTPVFDEEEEEE